MANRAKLAREVSLIIYLNAIVAQCTHTHIQTSYMEQIHLVLFFLHCMHEKISL